MHNYVKTLKMMHTCTKHVNLGMNAPNIYNNATWSNASKRVSRGSVARHVYKRYGL